MMGAFIIIGMVLFFTVIMVGIAIFIEEKRHKKYIAAVNSPQYLMDMAYLLSDDVNIFGGRVNGSENKTVEEVMLNGFNKAPVFKARYLNAINKTN